MNLYQVVEEYVALGPHHRTGTPFDETTRNWFSEMLRDAGLTVEEIPYQFERYDATGSVFVDGTEIESIPLWSRDAGTFSSDDPWIGRHIPGTQGAGDIDFALRNVSGDVGILQSALIADHPFAASRPAGRGSGTPIMITAAFRGQARVEFQARYEPAESATVLGRKGGSGGSPVVIATPLTGWFKSAGERGSSIAVALEMARRLPGPVLVVATTGQELNNHGLQSFLASHTNFEAKAVLHLGANIAAAGSGRRSALANRPRLDVRGIALTAFPSSWFDEGTDWLALGVPLLSFVGIHPTFRSSMDLPGVSTNPERLADTLTIVERALYSLLEGL